MPPSVAREFFERLSIVEEQVKALMVWQKWQMGILAIILAAVILKKF